MYKVEKVFALCLGNFKQCKNTNLMKEMFYCERGELEVSTNNSGLDWSVCYR